MKFFKIKSLYLVFYRYIPLELPHFMTTSFSIVISILVSQSHSIILKGFWQIFLLRLEQLTCHYSYVTNEEVARLAFLRN